MTKYPNDRIVIRLGTVMPHEYNWREQINRATDTLIPFVPMDVGKVCGLTAALDECLALLRQCHRWVVRGLNDHPAPDAEDLALPTRIAAVLAAHGEPREESR